jgi:hypothetical protein
LGDGEAALGAAEADLRQALQKLRLDSVEQAEELARQRESIERQLAALEMAERASGDGQAPPSPSAPAPPSLEQKITDLDTSLAELEGELAALEMQRRTLEAEYPLPVDEAGLDNLHRQLQQTYRQQRSSRQSAEHEVQQLETRRLQLSRSEAEAAQALAGLEAELRTRQERQRTLLERRGSGQALADALQALERQRLAAEAELVDLERQRQALQPGGAEARTQAIKLDIDNLRQHSAQLAENLGAARERCERISAEAPHAAVERAQVAHDAAVADHRAIERLTEAQKLLAQLFSEARSDLSSRYSQPLARSIERFLRPLVPDGPRCQLEFDQAKGFSGLQLRRAGEYFPFSQLSGGMREQVAAALRLAMADVLKGGHDGCLPLIFDDAFTNSDPKRIDGLKTMLRQAVQGGLQVILLTCHPESYRDLAAPAVDLSRADSAVGDLETL